MGKKGIYIKVDGIYMILLVFMYVVTSSFLLRPNVMLSFIRTHTMEALSILAVFVLVYKMVSFENVYLKGVILTAGIMLGTIYILSLYYEYNAGIVNTELGGGMFTLFFPLIVSIGAINSLDRDKLYDVMVAILIISIVAYLIELFTSGNVTLAAIKSISIKESYSPFESHSFSGISISLGAYFSYYRKEKKWTILSFLFSLMTFKRVPIIFAIILLVLPVIKKDLKIKHGNILCVAMTVIFSVLAIAYSFILMPQNVIFIDLISQRYLGLSASDLLMSRNILFERLIMSGYVRSGIDSTFVFSKNIEMDLVKIFMEVGAVGVFMIVFHFWRIAKDNLYSFIYMLSIMLNLLVSHSLHTPHGWIVKYILFFCILRDMEIDKKASRERKNKIEDRKN